VTKPGDTPGGQEHRSHTHPMRAPPRPAPASRCQPLPACARAPMAARAAWLEIMRHCVALPWERKLGPFRRWRVRAGGGWGLCPVL